MTDNEIFSKLLQEKIKDMDPEELIDFDGQNCHDLGEEPYSSCGGWDGSSRRCECGNRRVSWILSDCKTYIYAEAY